jgi:integrase
VARPRKRENLGLPSGMFSRRQRSGRVYFYACRKEGDSGRRKEFPLGCERIAAFRKYADVMELPSKPDYTFTDLVARYEKEVIPKKAPETQKGNRQELKELSKFFGSPPAPLNQITPQRVQQYVDLRGTKRANKEKALLSHMFNTARKWGWTSLANPCTGIRGLAERGRNLYIEDDAFELLKELADEPTRNALDLAYLTALRPGDLLSLTSEKIIGDELVVKPGKNQNSTDRIIRYRLRAEDGSWNLLGALLETLRPDKEKAPVTYALLRDANGNKFTYSQRRRGFDNAKKLALKQLIAEGNTALAAHISKIQFRDVRAKAATDKVIRTGDMRSAQMQLGHASATMTEHYVRARLGDVVEPTK